MLSYIQNTRRNHALEHATVQLLLTRLGSNVRLVGRASGGGFVLLGDLPSNLVADCAHEGLRRLQAGEGFWAVTNLCGTNLATAGVLASLSTMAMIGNGTHKGRSSNAIAAAIVAVTLAQPIGRWIQQYITTSPDLEGTEIVSIESKANGRFHRVRTRRVAAAPVAVA